MPQLQVVNTGASPINTVLGNISGNFIDSFNSRQQENKNDEIFSKIKSKYGPDADPDMIFKDVLQSSGMDQSYKKNILGTIKEYAALRSDKKRNSYEDAVFDLRKQELGITKEKFTHQKSIDEREIKLKEDKAGPSDTRIAQSSYNRLVDILKDNRIGYGSEFTSYVNGNTAEDIGEFKTLLGTMESILKEKVSKGVLSKDRFNYIIKELLPTPYDRQATIRGKLKGLAQVLELDSSRLTGKKSKTEPEIEDLKTENPPSNKIDYSKYLS